MKFHKTLLSGMLAVALAFGIALPLGFWLRPHFSAAGDEVFGALLAVVLVGIAVGVMRLLAGPLWPAKKLEIEPARRPDPDADPNKDWSSDGSGCRTGYEISFEDFRRLVSESSSQPVVAPLLMAWFRCEIAGQGSETVLRSVDGQPLGIRNLHNRIQVDPSKQRDIYGVAMDLWR
jgi:hypothetical protein